MLFDPRGTKWVLYGTLLIWALAFFVIGFRTAHDKTADGIDLHDKRDIEPNIDTEEDDDEEKDGEGDDDDGSADHDEDDNDDDDTDLDDDEERNERRTTNERRKKSDAKNKNTVAKS